MKELILVRGVPVSPETTERNEILGLPDVAGEFMRLRRENEMLRRERDEARREVCRLIDGRAGWSAEELAKNRGWNCFDNLSDKE